MMILALSHNELGYLAFAMQRGAGDVGTVTDPFRLRILEAYHCGGDPAGLSFALWELRLIDEIITPDSRGGKLLAGGDVAPL